MNAIERAITTWLYRIIIDSPEAHTVLLRMYLGGEDFHHRFPWFDQMDLVEDPELRLLMRQHLADEANHGKFFRLALSLKGDVVGPPPLELDALVQLAAAFWDEGILIGDTIEELQGPRLFTERQNLFVQLAFKDLSEKRAIGEFHIWRDLAKSRDPETYAILKRVVEDEDWHVKIFDEQVHRMMADPVHGPKLTAVYKRLVVVSKNLYRRITYEFLTHMLKRHQLLAKPWELACIRLMAWLSGLGAPDLHNESARRLMAMQAPVYDDSDGVPAPA